MDATEDNSDEMNKKLTPAAIRRRLGSLELSAAQRDFLFSVTEEPEDEDARADLRKDTAGPLFFP